MNSPNDISWTARGAAQCDPVRISLLNVNSSFAPTVLTDSASASTNAEGSWTWTPSDMSLAGGGYFVNVRCADGSFQDNSTEFVIDVTAAPSPAPTPAPTQGPTQSPTPAPSTVPVPSPTEGPTASPLPVPTPPPSP